MRSLRALAYVVLLGAAACNAFSGAEEPSPPPPVSLDGGDAGTTSDGGATADAAQADGDVPPAPSPSAYAGAVLADKPLAYWRLGDAAGRPRVFDLATKAEDATVAGATLGAKGALTGDADTAAHFAGSSAIVGDKTVPIASAFSVELWVRTEPQQQTSYFQNLFTQEWAEGGGRSGFGVVLQNGTPQVEHFAQSANGQKAGANSALVEGTWHHLVGTSDGQLLHLYVDAVLISSTTIVGTMGPATDSAHFVLGAGLDNVNAPLTGVLDEVAVYDVALPPDRIKAHYDAARP